MTSTHPAPPRPGPATGPMPGLPASTRVAGTCAGGWRPARSCWPVRALPPARPRAGVGTVARSLARTLMRTLGQVLVPAVLLAGLAVPALAQPARYEIDPDHFSVGFLVDHIGYAKVLGMFRAARGHYRFDESTATVTDMRVEIDAASVFSNHRRRDDHLKGPDFLNAAQHPRLVFTAERAAPVDAANAERRREFEIRGQLELLGRTRPVVLQARWNKSAESPIGGLRKPYVMGVSARGSFRRSEFGMMYAVDNGWVGDEVELILEFEAIRQ
jgi:polyisoprenoid-binding protein YceI